MEVCIPLREQLVPAQIARHMVVLIVVSIFGLHGVGGQQHSSLRRTVNVIIEDALFHLKSD